jgi:aminomethyltransferase
VPVGLGARDTLRLEAGLHLSGQDIDESTTVLEAGLGWIVGWKKEDFIGKAALERQKTSGLTRKLVGFEMIASGIARHGYRAYTAGGDGIVTSGTQTPFLKKAIGLAYLPIAAAEIGTEFEIDIRGRRTPARVVSSRFYKRPRS